MLRPGSCRGGTLSRSQLWKPCKGLNGKLAIDLREPPCDLLSLRLLDGGLVSIFRNSEDFIEVLAITVVMLLSFWPCRDLQLHDQRSGEK